MSERTHVPFFASADNLCKNGGMLIFVATADDQKATRDCCFFGQHCWESVLSSFLVFFRFVLIATEADLANPTPVEILLAYFSELEQNAMF